MDQNGLIQQFKKEGFVVVPSLFSAEEVEFFKAHFMDLNDAAGHGHDHRQPPLVA